MPFKIKFALSIVTLIVAAIAFYMQGQIGHQREQYLIAFLGLFMVFAMWLFPEVKREERKSQNRQPAA
ncbi:hypothetical protein [Afipia felis]|jgi:zinc transporter ZupT|uniref:Uncharacterized protein n=2 Tax=Afipia felis TaxID=1035 RepID=A0A380W6Z7_AFIFE|nr:hypothetical protein [Afipia felis]EKS27916.1 hypothetical protein HMPREF9697_00444 [Afipia felis ATCC 53690]SUU76626.1 Uncharacterised protein [Afipia felis]SUU84692.1 Uncharacterised protein [Afipia felis]